MLFAYPQQKMPSAISVFISYAFSSCMAKQNLDEISLYGERRCNKLDSTRWRNKSDSTVPRNVMKIKQYSVNVMNIMEM